MKIEGGLGTRRGFGEREKEKKKRMVMGYFNQRTLPICIKIKRINMFKKISLFRFF